MSRTREKHKGKEFKIVYKRKNYDGYISSFSFGDSMSYKEVLKKKIQLTKEHLNHKFRMIEKKDIFINGMYITNFKNWPEGIKYYEQNKS